MTLIPPAARKYLKPMALVLFVAQAGCSDADSDSASQSVQSVYADSGWPTIHADARNSDSTQSSGSTDLDFRWGALEGRMIGAGATVGLDGSVHVGVGGRFPTGPDPDCFLFVFDEVSGEQIWCSGAVNDNAVTSSPLIDIDGNIYHGDDRAMVSFTQDGEVRWSTPIVGFPISAQFTPDGALIFISHIGVIYVMNRSDGALLLEPIELIPGAEPRPGDELACLIGSSEGNCFSANTLSVDLESGRFFFTLSRPGQEEANVVAMRYIEGSPPRIESLWENATLEGGSASSPVISKNHTRLYVNDRGNNVLALDAETGEVLWRYDLGFTPLGSLSVSDDARIIPAGGPGGFVLALIDRGTHAELLWEQRTLRQLSVAMQTGNDLAYFAGTQLDEPDRLSLFTLDASSGEVLDVEALPFAFITVGTTMSPSGGVFVPALSRGLFGLRPAED